MTSNEADNDPYRDMRVFFTARRRTLGISQQNLAVTMGTTQSAVSDLETGKNKDPTMVTLRKWGRALDAVVRVKVQVVVRQEEPPARGID